MEETSKRLGGHKGRRWQPHGGLIKALREAKQGEEEGANSFEGMEKKQKEPKRGQWK